MNNPQASIDYVIEKLEANHYINSDQVSQIKNQDLNKINKLPIANEILIGFGAFVSTLFFCLFVGATSFMSIEPKYLYLFWSGVFILGALSINWLVRKKEYNSSSAYWRDVSICFMIAGKALFLGACQGFFLTELESLNIFIISSIFISVVIYPIYDNSIDRFISVGAVLCLIWIKILYSPMSDFSNQSDLYHNIIQICFNTNVFMFFHFILLGYFVCSKKVLVKIEPIKYAILFSVLLYFIVPKWGYSYHDFNLVYFNFFISSLVVFSASALILALNEFKYKWPSQPLTAILILIIFLGLILPPEVIFALTLILYGYGYRENKILIIGLFFFPIFMFIYYYHLPVSLLYKSIYLLTSGGLLIAFGLYYQYYFTKVKKNV